MRSQSRGWLILGLFFCSGATALVYEVVWSKFLSQMFGSTIYAQTVVLAVFMGGLALGNRIFGRWADELERPVKAYGYLEIAIGVYAFCFPALDRGVDGVFIAVGSHFADQAGILLGLKGVLSMVLLLGPTVLMGGTLPLLAAWLQKYSEDAGRRSARFYSVNSLGAVLGAALAGFWLVQGFGMVKTLHLTALGNVAVGISAILLSRVNPARSASSTGSAAGLQPGQTGVFEPAVISRWAGALVALTGAVSMGLEVLSSRSLALIFGSSLQTFAVVLMAFILGIGLGSAWIASPRRHGRTGRRTSVVLLCAAAGWVLLVVLKIEDWVNVYGYTHTGIGLTPVGYVFHLMLATLMSLVILGVPAACIGAVLPLMIRSASQENALLGREVGALLTWNTLGAVVGSLFTGFVLMPWIGLRSSFGVLALALALAGLVLAWQRGWRLGVAGAMSVCVLAGCLFVFGDKDWQNVMSTGIFRLRATTFDPQGLEVRKQHVKIIFYKDGPDATVSVEKIDGIIAPSTMCLRVNGKPDAGTGLDLSTQLLVSHLPMLARPGAKDVFVLGLASGMSAGVPLGYPIERLDVAENCQPVIDASHVFDDWNHHILSNPRTHLWREDARTVLKLHPQQYDVIVAEPSNPWTAGVGSVFSREFYELAARRLKTGGIISQWFQVYETQDDIVDLVLRTFSSVFPYVEIWDAGGGDIVLLGSLQPWATGPDIFRKGFQFERVRTDMAMIDVRSPETLLSRQLASQQTGFAIAGKGPLQSDLFPILEYTAPRALFMGTESHLLQQFDERTHQQLFGPTQKRKLLGSLPFADAQLVFGTFATINGELYGCLFGLPMGVGVPCVFRVPDPISPDSSGAPLDQAARAFAAGNLDLAGQLVAEVLKQDPGDARAGYINRVVERARKMEKKEGQSLADTR